MIEGRDQTRVFVKYWHTCDGHSDLTVHSTIQPHAIWVQTFVWVDRISWKSLVPWWLLLQFAIAGRGMVRVNPWVEKRDRDTFKASLRPFSSLLASFSFCNSSNRLPLAGLEPPVRVPAGSYTSPSNVTDLALTSFANVAFLAAFSSIKIHIRIYSNSFLKKWFLFTFTNQSGTEYILHGGLDIVVESDQFEGKSDVLLSHQLLCVLNHLLRESPLGDLVERNDGDPSLELPFIKKKLARNLSIYYNLVVD